MVTVVFKSFKEHENTWILLWIHIVTDFDSENNILASKRWNFNSSMMSSGKRLEIDSVFILITYNTEESKDKLRYVNVLF